MILYRPVGKRELELIEQSGYRAFPPRLPEQPIFYPVLNQRYAQEIAGRWNTRDARSGYRGYVTRFEVEDRYISRFESHVVGASWLPGMRNSGSRPGSWRSLTGISWGGSRW